jgi:hypothetical protein
VGELRGLEFHRRAHRKGWSARELDQAGRELGLTVGELEPALWEGAARLASRMAQEAPFSVQ